MVFAALAFFRTRGQLAAWRNADFTWSGQLRGSGKEHKLGSIQAVVVQAGRRSKGRMADEGVPRKTGQPASTLAGSLLLVARTSSSRTPGQDSTIGILVALAHKVIGESLPTLG